jgi:NADPH2:quinone reductase
MRTDSWRPTTIVEVVEGVLGFAAADEVYGCAGGVKGLGGTLAE